MSRFARPLLLVLLLTGCGDKEADDTGAVSDTDAGTDGADTDGADTDGADTDADTDGADTDADTDGSDTDADTESGDTDSDAGVPADALVDQTAAAWCAAVLGCCDGEDQAWAFAPYATDDRLSHLHDRMPPNATLDAESCTALVSDILPELWMGQWLGVHAAGLVDYDGAQAETCIDELSSATCGEPLRDALFDSTCFAPAAPAGGEEQRRMFERTATSGDCAPIADGFGGLFYGSCDPAEAFCCIDTGDGCDPFPIPGDGGTCTAASQVGGSCSDTAPIQLCATGLVCTDGTCAAPRTDALALGEACYDSSSYTLLGDCTDGWCDLFGSGVCEAPKDDGQACWSGEECASGYCDPVALSCAVDDTCDG